MFQLKDQDQKILFGILKKYSDLKFYVFGSRANNLGREYSDIDIAYSGTTHRDITKLKNELEESNLSIKVDLVDLNAITEDFRKHIQNEMVEIKL